MVLNLPKTSNYSDQSVNPARLGRAGLTELLQMMTTAHNVIGSVKMYNYIYLCYFVFFGGGDPPPPLMSIIKFGGGNPFKWYYINQKHKITATNLSTLPALVEQGWGATMCCRAAIY